jgi:hypothetical protein
MIAVLVTGEVASSSIVRARSSSETRRIVSTGTSRRRTKVVSWYSGVKMSRVGLKSGGGVPWSCSTWNE